MEAITAKKIQEDILSAQVALMEESNAALVKAKNEPKHIESLKELGFSESAEALERRLKHAKQLLDLQEMYSFEYPGLKFIPDSVMSKVCMKYGLAIGYVSRYIGEVPPWALEQIKANKHHFMQVEMHVRLVAFGEDGEKYFTYEDGSQVVSKDLPPKKMRSNLMIAAPQKDMRIDFDERVDENGNIVVQDPIVCLQVNGGYIVLAAWGEEGQDPQVFNVTNN
jgi:hypothetical protein